MKRATFQADRYYQIVVAFGGFILLAYGLWHAPQASTEAGYMLLLALFCGALVQYPLSIFQGEINFIQVVALAGSVTLGAIPTVLATAFGLLLGYIFRWIAREKRSWRRLLRFNAWIKIGYAIGVNCIPPVVIFWFWGPSEAVATSASGVRFWSIVLLSATLFVVLHGILFAGRFFLRQQPFTNPDLKKDFVALSILELISIPFAFLIVNAFQPAEFQSLVLLGVGTITTAYLLYRGNAAQLKNERRIRELSTLKHISQTLRTTLDLEELLPVIQEQVMQLLDVNNFYVALHDRDKEELWYPFAVKYGQKQYWPRREMADRLTDRVIRDGKAILLTPDTQPILAPVGLPPSEDSPSAWLGVPLISSERSIGCLAVFKLEPGTYFTSADADVLTTLSGQVSVAIENALLYQQAQNRARQLETLNQLTGAITASLDLQEVLTQVCSSVALVVDAQRSAVFLLDPGGDTISLAYAHGLAESFEQRNESFSIANSRRARCLRTGRPVIIPDIETTSLSLDLIQLFKSDQIYAFADFPLITPDGQIGFLAVYFDEKHHFNLEEVGLLQTFASQAALAVANARLHARTDAALARRVNQLTTLEAVGRELSAATHSDRLFTLILEYALEMTNSSCGTVTLFNTETQTMGVKASYGYNLTNDEFPIHNGITGRVAKTRKIANVGDVSQDPDFLDLRNGNTCSQLSVPIIYENRILGVLSLESNESNAYSESEEAFVTQLANQAAIDIANADLYHETQRLLREQSTLYQVSTRLVSAISPEHVAQTISQAIDAVLQPLETGVYNWNEEMHSYTLLGKPSEHLPTEISDIHIDDFVTRSTDAIPNALSPNDKLGIALSENCQSCQIFNFPLAMAQQKLGLVVLHISPDQDIAEDEARLLKAVIAQGAIALQNAHHFHEATDGRDRMVAILNSIEEGILMADTEGRILLVNEPIRILSGLPLEQFLETPLQELPDSTLKTLGYNQSEVVKLIKSLGQMQVPISPKTSFEVSEPQRTRIIERITTPVWRRDGIVIGWMMVLRDITEEHEIEQTREAITQTLVHDLRSPMSAIIGALDLLSSSLSDLDDPIVQQSLMVAQRSANRILALTQALLDIARLESGQLEILTEKLDLPPLVSELMVEFTALANEDSVIIRSDIPTQLPPVCADREKIVRVLTNLVDNAIKFTPEGEHITISAMPAPNDMVAIKVIDSGPGVPLDYREKIFERFVQVPGQRARRRGTGLGLAFCRLTVEAHGGSIWVDSPPEGGSIFTFTLPMASP